MNPEIKRRIEQICRGDVPEEYKKAIVGIIPDSWEPKKLKDICEINPPRKKKEPAQTTFLGMSDVDDSGHIIAQHKMDIHQIKSGLTPFERGDILVAKITPCFENGKGANTKTLQTETGFGSTEFHVLRNEKDGDFIFYHTISHSFRQKLEREMTGSAGQKRVQVDSLGNYVIPFPGRSERRSIVDILSAQDSIIVLKEKRLAEKQQQKKYIMQQLLTGKRRIPGFRNEWREVRLYEILTPGSKAPVSNTKNHQRITIKLNFKGIEYANVSREMADTRPFYVRKSNEIIIGKQNYFNGSIALVSDQFDGCICSNAIMSFSVHGANTYYVLKYLSQDDFLRQHQMLANGTGQKELSEKDFLQFIIKLPPIDEQAAIAKVLSTADRENDLLRQDIEQEKQKKKALMQLLLTGIVRVTPCH